MYFIIALLLAVVSIGLNFYIYKNGLFGWDPYGDQFEDVHFWSFICFVASVCWPITVVALGIVLTGIPFVLLYKIVFKKFKR